MQPKLQELLEIAFEMNFYEIGSHIEAQLLMFTFRTWEDWHRHATEFCPLCKAVLDRLIALDFELPLNDTPIQDVVNSLKSL